MSDSPPPTTHERTVTWRDSGTRLDVFLGAQPEVERRALAKSMIQRGCVLVDGAAAKPGWSLSVGQVVTFRLIDETNPVDPAAVALWSARLDVLYEDAWILVVDKPAGLATHRPDHDKGGTLVNVADLAVARCGELALRSGEDRPGIVHRLDKETSGVMVLARTDEAHAFLQAQFKARTVTKEYRAIAWGEPRFDSDWIDRPIATHPGRGDRMTVVREGGKPASTYYEVVERFRGVTHFRCLPKSGRTHQIRVHLASVGHALVADRLYRSRNQTGVERELPGDAPLPKRHALHARHLEFEHPRTRERVAFDAPLPADLTELLRWLRAERPADA